MTDRVVKDDEVSLSAKGVPEVEAPELEYQPQGPTQPKTRTALIGCGGIVSNHLEAMKHWGVEVKVLCDIKLDRAKERRDQWYPEADVTDDAQAVFSRDDVEAVDLALHPEVRAPQIEAALKAGKHVLSQKPFALDLEVAHRLVDLAKAQDRVLAVNQNGRWAPYVGWAILAAKRGLLGDIQTLDWTMQWDHTWTKGTAFEKIHHLLLYDFAIHWIDITAQVFFGREATDVFARVVEAKDQEIRPPALGNISIGFDHGLATLGFSAHAKHGPQERFAIVGSKGTLRGAGDLCRIESLDLFTEEGHATIPLEGNWFPGGFIGTLGEFLLAIEERREPCHSGADNLRSLELCFAAIGSADTRKPVKPGDVRKISK